MLHPDILRNIYMSAGSAEIS